MRNETRVSLSISFTLKLPARKLEALRVTLVILEMLRALLFGIGGGQARYEQKLDFSNPFYHSGPLYRDGGLMEIKTQSSELALKARHALEHVCSGRQLDCAPKFYSAEFVDYVNGTEFRGFAGIRASVSLYRKALSDLSFSVQEQVMERDFVVSRFLVTGSSYGRQVSFSGITISRFKGGLIVEDWSLTDTLGMLRQLGWWRAALMAIKSWKGYYGKRNEGCPLQA